MSAPGTNTSAKIADTCSTASALMYFAVSRASCRRNAKVTTCCVASPAKHLVGLSVYLADQRYLHVPFDVVLLIDINRINPLSPNAVRVSKPFDDGF
jgi:hypothetical protein